MTKKFYAVKRGVVPGIYTTWDECKKQVDKFPNASYKGFASKEEALSFINSENENKGKVVKKVIEKKEVKKKEVQKDDIGDIGDAIVVYCDGACSNNGQVGAKAGVGVWFGDESDLNVSEPLQGDKQTNQRAELTAAARTIEQTNLKYGVSQSILICTDSKYTISCATEWIKKWKRNGYKNAEGNEVLNRDLVQRLDSLLSSRPGKVSWKHIKGHAGNVGNEKADALAVAGCNIPIKSFYLSSNSTPSSTSSLSFATNPSKFTSPLSKFFSSPPSLPVVNSASKCTTTTSTISTSTVLPQTTNTLLDVIEVSDDEESDTKRKRNNIKRKNEELEQNDTKKVKRESRN